MVREIKQKGTDSNFAGTPPLALVRFVIGTAATKTRTGEDDNNSWYSTRNEHSCTLTL